jgi:hypothetical protein
MAAAPGLLDSRGLSSRQAYFEFTRVGLGPEVVEGTRYRSSAITFFAALRERL